MTASVLIRIARKTRPFHAQADADRLTWMDAASTGEYRRFLERAYGLESAVLAAASAIDELGAATAGARIRIERLEEDLAGVGVSVAARLPRAHVRMITPAGALAWLFVIERHVLLAGLIRRSLEAQGLDAIPHASRYLTPDIDGGSCFRAFGGALADCVREGMAHPDEIARAAADAFAAQHQWHSRLTRLRARPSSQMIVPRQIAVAPRDAA